MKSYWLTNRVVICHTGLTLRLASTFTKRKDQLVSLINNFDLMMSVMAVKIFTMSLKIIILKICYL